MTPGTKVVCIDASGAEKLLVLNKEYKILATRDRGCNCGGYFVDVGIRDGRRFMCCLYCDKITPSDGIRWFSVNRFVPIDSISITEVYEQLEKQPFEV